MSIHGVNPPVVNQTPQYDGVQAKTESNVAKASEVIGELEADTSVTQIEISQDLMDKSVAQANESLKTLNRHIEREVHEVTHSVMYKLKDSISGEVIAEFPPKRIQDMVAKMWELAGLFVDEQA